MGVVRQRRALVFMLGEKLAAASPAFSAAAQPQTPRVPCHTDRCKMYYYDSTFMSHTCGRGRPARPRVPRVYTIKPYTLYFIYTGGGRGVQGGRRPVPRRHPHGVASTWPLGRGVERTRRAIKP